MSAKDVKQLQDTPALITALARISEAGARRSFLRENRDLHSPAVVQLLYDHVVKLARIDVRQAERLAQAADWIAVEVKDDCTGALARRAVLHVLLYRG